MEICFSFGYLSNIYVIYLRQVLKILIEETKAEMKFSKTHRTLGTLYTKNTMSRTRCSINFNKSVYFELGLSHKGRAYTKYFNCIYHYKCKLHTINCYRTGPSRPTCGIHPGLGVSGPSALNTQSKQNNLTHFNILLADYT